MYPKQNRSIIRIILHSALVLITIISSAALFAGYTTTWVSPAKIWWLAFLGLGLHLMMLWNLLLMCYWMARMRWWAALPAITLLVGIGHAADYIQLSPVKHYSTNNQSQPMLTVATYNVHTFHELDNPQRTPQIIDSIGTTLELYQPDIICFQEYSYNRHRDSALVANTFSKWPYHTFIPTSNYYHVQVGLSIWSKHKIIPIDTLFFPETANSAMSVDMIYEHDTIRVFNCHLQSTEFNQVQPTGLRAVVQDNEIDTEQAVQNIGSALKRNFIKRAAQADTLAVLISRSPYPVIVTGDFNDTPASYVVNTIGKNLRDSYRTAGSGYQYTYRPMLHLFRIDYILYAPERLDAVQQFSPELVWSDHKPVISQFNILPRK